MISNEKRTCSRRALLALLAFSLIPCWVAGAADCLAPQSGLIGWWPGDGNANDIAGTNPGILQGGALANGTGMVGSAFALDGTNRYVQIPDSPGLKPANLTVMCWVRFNSLNSAGSGAGPGQQYLVFKQNSRNENFEGFELSKDRFTSDVFLFRVSSSAGEEAAVVSFTQVTTNVWYHLAAVRGPNSIQLYVNGQLEGQVNVGFPQDYGSLPLYFGTSGQPFFDRRLAGTLDEVALYNRALSPSEISADFVAGGSGKCKVPTVLTHPQGGARYWNSSITLASAVAGALPLGYQWQKDGFPLAGASASSLPLAHLSFSNTGTYTLLGTNAYGSATSAPALLTVKFAELAIRKTNGGAALMISALINQTYGIQYCSALGESAGWLGLANTTLNSSTNIWKDAEVLTVGSRFYRLVPGPITIPPRIVIQPQGADLYWGGGITLTSAAAGDLPLSFQWQKDGVPISGATNATLGLTNLQTANSGVYSLLVTNSVGAVSSLPAGVNVREVDLSLTQTNSGGQTLTGLSMSGASGVTYGIQFSEDLVTWSALTNITLLSSPNSWFDLQGGSGGRYYRVVPGPILAPGAVPFLMSQPQSATAYWGSSITFTSAAWGVFPLFYQWKKDGAAIPRSSDASLNLTNLQMSDAGQYTLLITNIFGAVTSQVASLTMKVAEYNLGLATGVSAGNPMLTIMGVPGQTYKIQSSASLFQSDAWSDATNLTLTAATNYWVDPRPPTDANRYYRVLPGSPWEWSDMGAVWSDNFNRSALGSNWIVLGPANPTIVSNQLLLDFASVDLSRQIYYDPWYINSDAWTIRWSQRFAVLNSSSYGVGVGIKNFQAAGGNDRGYNGVFFGAGSYLGKMNIQRYDGAQHLLVTSGPAIAVSAGDVVDCTLTRSGWTMIATASNRVNAQVSSTSFVFSDPANLIAPTISRVCIYPFLGTVYLDDLSYTINRKKPARFMMIGASMGEGYNASDYSKTFISVVQSNFQQTICNESSSYNTTTNSLNILPEILAHRPQTAVLMIGGNDLQFGYPTNQWQSQYSNLVAQLQLNGVRVKHSLNPPRNVVNLLPLRDWITANYPARDIIDTWTPLLTGNSLLNPAYDSGDGVHPNDAGHLLIGTIISTNLTIDQTVVVTGAPASVTNCPSTTASFNVTATGTGLSYQWYKGGSALVGQTGSSLILNNVSPADAGTYSVTVSGIYGNSVSSSANLTVNQTVVVTGAPASVTNCPSTTASFNITATGTGLSYQWYKGGSALVGQTGSSLILNNVSPADAGSYSVTVTGVCGNSVSSSANLTVNQNVVVTGAPASATNCPSTTASFNVTAIGTGLSYQWLHNGTPLAGQTRNTLNLANAQLADAGRYDVVVSGACGLTQTNGAMLVLNALVLVTSGPFPQTVCSGNSATFSVMATGTGLSYQSYKGASALVGQTGSSLILNNVSAADAGSYSVTVTGVCGNSVSSSANLTVNQNVVVTGAPASVTNCPATTASFNVTATGTGMSYQWYKGASPLAGQTGSSLILNSVSAADAGSYSVTVSGVCGNNVTSSANLAVNQNVTITTSPSGAAVYPGDSATFSVSASATGLTYQWFKNGALLSGEIRSRLRLNEVSAADAGTYSVVVSGACGNSVTNSAALTVN